MKQDEKGDEQMNILVFGDSIAYGIADKEKGGWVNRLRFALVRDRDEKEFALFNMSIGGQTTEEIKVRFADECNNRRSGLEDTLIIFAIGINDTALVQGAEKRPIEDFRRNMIDLVGCAKTYAAHVLAVGLTKADETRTRPVGWNENVCYLNDRIAAYDRELAAVCVKYGIDYLPVFSLLTADDLADGLHPNESGHQKMCEVILQYVSKAYLS
ncbi:MAG: hypothetical protein HFE78_02445 [Clostridiales bacterium]|nr:hypothetical protein [Clostridiales bacterium]